MALNKEKLSIQARHRQPQLQETCSTKDDPGCVSIYLERKASSSFSFHNANSSFDDPCIRYAHTERKQEPQIAYSTHMHIRHDTAQELYTESFFGFVIETPCGRFFTVGIFLLLLLAVSVYIHMNISFLHIFLDLCSVQHGYKTDADVDGTRRRCVDNVETAQKHFMMF